MQSNWCKCKINHVNSCKIKAWLFSEILPGSQVHWATVTSSPLKILEVERLVFCHYYSLMKFEHSSVHRKCALIILSVLLHSKFNLCISHHLAIYFRVSILNLYSKTFLLTSWKTKQNKKSHTFLMLKK